MALLTQRHFFQHFFAKNDPIGCLLFSNTLREPEALGLSDTMSVPIEDERLAHYLREHKRTVFITER